MMLAYGITREMSAGGLVTVAADTVRGGDHAMEVARFRMPTPA